LGEADHGKAASYRSNRGFVITQSNIKRFFDVQEVNIPRPSYDQDKTHDSNHVGKDGSAHGQPSGCIQGGLYHLMRA
jgi:hypothetical protein